MGRPINLPETCEYIEKVIPASIDDPINYAGSIELRFRQYTDSKGYTFPIPGVKTEQHANYKIQVNKDLPFKSGDIIRFGRDDKRRYSITNIDYSSNSEEDTYRRTYLYPLESEAVKMKTLSLE